MTALLWFRRDLRLGDHPALCAAAGQGPVLPVFVLDPALTRSPGRRLQRLLGSLAALRAATDGALVVRTGRPAAVLPQLAREAGAGSVHISVETTPYGRRRDRAVYEALSADGVQLVGTGSPYAVTPGRVRKGDGTPFKVFTPFARAWRAHGWRAPATLPRLEWADGVASEPVTAEAAGCGEQAALERWLSWRDNRLDGHPDTRNRPDLDATSRLSAALKYGEIHPRTLLAGVPDDEHPRFVTELCWREFYADVLHHHPGSAWQDLRPLGVAQDDPADAADVLRAWQQGRAARLIAASTSAWRPPACTRPARP